MQTTDHVARHWLRRVAWEAALVVPAVAAYFAVRNVTAGGAGAAFENADRIVRLERALGLFQGESVQAAITGSETLVTLANWVYIWGHWPVILATGVTLFLLRRDRYWLLRNAMFVSGAIGFLFFALFPVAPPRLLDLGLLDTVTEQSTPTAHCNRRGSRTSTRPSRACTPAGTSWSESSSSARRPTSPCGRSPCSRRSP